MLRTRVLTALALMALLVPALLAASAWPFQLLTLAMIGAAAWEWGRLNGARQGLSLVFAATLVLACGAAWRAGWTRATPAVVWWVAAALWVVGAALALRAGPPAWPKLPQLLRWTVGLVVLWSSWLAIAAARERGLNFIISIFCIVWMADIAAYFGGRAWGRRKLAPSISPGKSWEGVWSGLAAVLLLAMAWLAWQHSTPEAGPSIHSELWLHFGPAIGAVVLLALTGMSVVGDLMESLVKRAAGAKDSSRLLPGHGGVLDRVDALLPTFPLAMALASWVPA